MVSIFSSSHRTRTKNGRRLSPVPVAVALCCLIVARQYNYVGQSQREFSSVSSESSLDLKFVNNYLPSSSSLRAAAKTTAINGAVSGSASESISDRLSSPSEATQQTTLTITRPSTTLKDILNHESKAGCGPEYKNDPVAIQDKVNQLIGHYILKEPAVPLTSLVPPKTEPDCRDASLFTGTQTDKTVLYSAFMFSHELDLLEARLMEGIGIVDKVFLAESKYTHRGHIKAKFARMAFQQTDGRLYKALRKANIDNPSEYVHILDLDEYCPKYVEIVQDYRNLQQQGKEKPNEIWDTQSTSQSCLATFVRHYAIQHAPDALVQVSDLDEILWRQTLTNIKYCQFVPERLIDWKNRNGALAFQKKWHMSASTTKWGVGKFCEPVKNQVIPRILIPAIEMDHARNAQEVIQYRAQPQSKIRRPQTIGRPQTVRRGSGISGGIHMTYMGGALLNHFKVSNHAEGGQMERLGFVNETYSPSVCTATKEDWYRMEELVCYDMKTVLKPGGVGRRSPPRKKRAEYFVSQYEPRHLPWVLVQNRARYPCFFANTKACVETYIDYVWSNASVPDREYRRDKDFLAEAHPPSQASQVEHVISAPRHQLVGLLQGIFSQKSSDSAGSVSLKRISSRPERNPSRTMNLKSPFPARAQDKTLPNASIVSAATAISNRTRTTVSSNTTTSTGPSPLEQKSNRTNNPRSPFQVGVGNGTMPNASITSVATARAISNRPTATLNHTSVATPNRMTARLDSSSAAMPNRTTTILSGILAAIPNQTTAMLDSSSAAIPNQTAAMLNSSSAAIPNHATAMPNQTSSTKT